MDNNEIKAEFNERVNYIIDKSSGKDVYIGYVVNYPMIITQADSLEELSKRIKGTYKMLIEFMKENSEKDNFEFREINISDWYDSK